MHDHKKWIESVLTVQQVKLFTPKPAAWDGEGLPPIGTECEFLIDRWRTCRILFAVKSLIVFYDDEGLERCRNVDSVKFRPIKTEGEKSYEEMMNIWREGDGDVRTFCRDLYLKGYRRIPDA